MKELTTVNQMWENLKTEDEEDRLTIETSEKVISLINKIINARKEQNISQRELAKKCGLLQPALARIESFKTIPKINTLIKIAECVNLSIEALDEQQKNSYLEVSRIASVVMQITYETRSTSMGGYLYGRGNN